MYMFNWIKNFLKEWEQMEHESIKAGIIHCYNPYTGITTHVDQVTYKKYIDDKQKAIRENNTET
jgi:hypothetical protein